jgi:hypothetical protein
MAEGIQKDTTSTSSGADSMGSVCCTCIPSRTPTRKDPKKRPNVMQTNSNLHAPLLPTAVVVVASSLNEFVAATMDEDEDDNGNDQQQQQDPDDVLSPQNTHPTKATLSHRVHVNPPQSLSFATTRSANVKQNVEINLNVLWWQGSFPTWAHGNLAPWISTTTTTTTTTTTL